MHAKKTIPLKKDELKTYLLEVSDIGEIRLDAIKNRIKGIDDLLESFGQPPSEGDFLLVVMNGKPHSWFPLSSDLINIGREESSDIILEDPKTSRSHCQIRKKGNNWLIEDKKSRNGIFVNGKKITERLLCEGDIIRIGKIELIYINNRKPDFV
ncbi:MAG: FHA domain-containing protein [Victivallales bacterium]|jgi:adenylate cyclase